LSSNSAKTPRAPFVAATRRFNGDYTCFRVKILAFPRRFSSFFRKILPPRPLRPLDATALKKRVSVKFIKGRFFVNRIDKKERFVKNLN